MRYLGFCGDNLPLSVIIESMSKKNMSIVEPL
jgi:hypothetical protein